MATPASSYGLSRVGGTWVIYQGDDPIRGTRVWERVSPADEDTGEYFWPADQRAEYERLTGQPEFREPDPDAEAEAPINLVEYIADDDEVRYDQPCKYASHVVGHAVYCHATHWLYAPRKCRRGWDDNYEACPAFAQNPAVPPKAPSA